MDSLQAILPGLSAALIEELTESASLAEVAEQSELIRDGQYIKVIPLVLEGLVKVFTRNEEKELLLYYIKPGESCVMTFSACLKGAPSKIYAVTETPSKVLLIPAEKLPDLLRDFPSLNSLFFNQYHIRYNEMLDTINHIIFDKMDKRLLDYLVEKVQFKKVNPIKISHRQIANELGTAREVVSRVMKKLEMEGVVEQSAGHIKVLTSD